MTTPEILYQFSREEGLLCETILCDKLNVVVVCSNIHCTLVDYTVSVEVTGMIYTVRPTIIWKLPN